MWSLCYIPCINQSFTLVWLGSLGISQYGVPQSSPAGSGSVARKDRQARAKTHKTKNSEDLWRKSDTQIQYTICILKPSVERRDVTCVLYCPLQLNHVYSRQTLPWMKSACLPAVWLLTPPSPTTGSSQEPSRWTLCALRWLEPTIYVKTDRYWKWNLSLATWHSRIVHATLPQNLVRGLICQTPISSAEKHRKRAMHESDCYWRKSVYVSLILSNQKGFVPFDWFACKVPNE